VVVEVDEVVVEVVESDVLVVLVLEEVVEVDEVVVEVVESDVLVVLVLEEVVEVDEVVVEVVEVEVDVVLVVVSGLTVTYTGLESELWCDGLVVSVTYAQ